MRRKANQPHPYDDAAKQAAREEVWGVLSSNGCNGLTIMFPGPRRHEFDTAVRHGWKPEQIILVEENGAVKANFTRQFSSQRERDQLQWQKGWLSDVSKELVAEGKLVTAAHLDFCKPLGFIHTGTPAVEIMKFMKSCVMLEGMLAITVLGGREQDGTDDDAIRYHRMQAAVHFRIKSGIPRKATLVSRGKYWNPISHNPMIWGIFQIERTK